MFCAWIQVQHAQACQQHVGTNLQLWMPCNTNNTNNICFAPMPWAAGIQDMMPKACTCLPCFRVLHILWVAACINHGKGGRVALWHKARHWWLPHSLGIFALVQGHAHSLEQPGQCRVATAYSLCVPSMRKLTGEPRTFSFPQPKRFFTLQAEHKME